MQRGRATDPRSAPLKSLTLTDGHAGDEPHPFIPCLQQPSNLNLLTRFASEGRQHTELWGGCWGLCNVEGNCYKQREV